MMELKDYLIETAEYIKSFGFRVFVKDGSTYGYYSDGKGIGYFQVEWTGTELDTVNAKHSACSGYSVKGEPGGYLWDELSEEVLRKGFATYPDWVQWQDRKRCTKHRDLDHFLSEYWDTKNLREI